MIAPVELELSTGSGCSSRDRNIREGGRASTRAAQNRGTISRAIAICHNSADRRPALLHTGLRTSGTRDLTSAVAGISAAAASGSSGEISVSAGSTAPFVGATARACAGLLGGWSSSCAEGRVRD